MIGPELGVTQPGMTIVCGDSHTSTHGAFGALAFGIGTSEVEHVLATQTLQQSLPKTMQVAFDGELPFGLSAKDLVLAAIGQLGVAGGQGYVLEYTGAAIEALSMEGRMTVCNMSIEAGARAGMIAPDDVTFAYLEGRPGVHRAAQRGSRRSRRGARSGPIPGRPTTVSSRRAGTAEAAGHVGDEPRHGRDRSTASCRTRPTTTAPTSARRSSEPSATWTSRRARRSSRCGSTRSSSARARTHGSRICEPPPRSPPEGRWHDGVHAIVVPGSAQVKRQAEAEGLHVIFESAGFEWRRAGCSMCLGMNPDVLAPGERCASTSNRNFEGRQGAGGRTHLVSPAMAAAAAVTGHFTDVRELA